MKIRDLTLSGLVFALILYLMRQFQADQAANVESIAKVMADAAQRAVDMVNPPPPPPVTWDDSQSAIITTDVRDPFDAYPLPEYGDDRIVVGYPGMQAELPDNHSPMI